ncbi:MAG: alpha-E domain-containing protein [Fimbriimonas sp.]
MLSRDADSVFWIGRNIERAEATARMIDVHYHYGLESPLVGETFRWSSILAISGQQQRYAEKYGEPDERGILQFFAFDQSNPTSIHSCIYQARENARMIRDQVSSEMWECLNHIYLDYRQWNVKKVLAATPHTFFQKVKDSSHLFQGITNRTLMMGEARDFHDAGRFLERADQTARILDVKYHDLLPKFSADQPEWVQRQEQRQGERVRGQFQGPDPASVGGPVDLHGWIAVLKSVGAFEAFRKTYHQGVSPTRVAEFLILNPQFPASVRHSIGRIDGCLRRVTGNSGSGPSNPAERAVGRLYQDLNYLSAQEIIAGGLHEFLTNVQDRCVDIGNEIANTFLRY